MLILHLKYSYKECYSQERLLFLCSASSDDLQKQSLVSPVDLEVYVEGYFMTFNISNTALSGTALHNVLLKHLSQQIKH